MSRWFRHYVGMCSDPKFGGIARRAKASRDRVVFVFAFILESAAEHNDGGSFAWDADAVADLLNCETDEIERIHAELFAAGLVAPGQVTKWASRQYEDRTNAERQARYKEKQRAGNAPVTEAECVTNAPHSTETDTEKKEVEARVPLAPLAKPISTKKGFPLPADWKPTDADWAEAVRTLGQPRAELELAKFRDHWLAASGKAANKADWDATWRNWFRKAPDFLPRQANGSPAGVSTKRLGLDESHDAAKATGKVYVLRDSPAGDAWNVYKRKTTGRSYWWDQNGGNYFPSEFPPAQSIKQGAAA